MRLLNSMLLAAGLAIPGLMMAGNVPQYTIKRTYTTGDDAPLGEGWSLFSDGTVITTPNRTNFEPAVFIFADGVESVNGYRGPGFPIGFDFRFAGQLVDQFAVTSNGMIQFGKGQVDYRGANIALIKDPTLTPEAPFQICMAPIYGGAKKGTISYKTIGEEGNRICIVQWKTMIVDENAATVDYQRAKFSLQMRLYEADGRIEMAFIGEQSPMGNLGFYTGLHGWSNEDQLIVATNPRQGQAYSISAPVVARDVDNVNMLEPDTYISWRSDDDDDESFVLSFFAPEDTPAPDEAPLNLVATQSGANITVKCDKAEGADATMIAYSNSPFTDADLPVDGSTYRVVDNTGDYISHIGNSTVIFYSNAEHPEAVIENVEASGNYYFRAYSVNGYPNYNTQSVAEALVSTTQLPPTGFFTETRQEGANLYWSSDYPVIVALSTEIPKQYFETYQGVFGQPAADVAVGDEIPGGGKVVYVGDGSECLVPVSELKANFPNMFRIWNVKDGVVSSTANNSYAIPEISLPYEPEVETWPYSLLPIGWQTSNENSGWTPRYRDYDRTQSLNGTFFSSAEAGYPVTLTLTTPEIPFENGPALLEFEWALETVRDPAPADPSNPTGPMLARGREAGWFGEVPNGTPGLSISVGPMGMTEVVKVIDKYEGHLVEFAEDNYYDGSASWEPVSVELGELKGKNVIAFTGCCEKTSVVYLRKIKVTQASGVTDIVPASDLLTVSGVQGGIVLRSDEARTVEVFNMLGMRVAVVDLMLGESVNVALPAGIYVAGGVKTVVR